MNAERYCAYNLTRQRFVATDVEAADGATNSSELRLLEMAPGEDTALWIFPYRKLSSSSARFPIDLVLLDSNSTVLDTVEFFPMNVVGEESTQATSVLVLAADSVAQRGIKTGDQLAISAPEEMMVYLQRAQNDGTHSLEPARVIPWPKDTGSNEERITDTKEKPARDTEPAKPRKPKAVEAPEPPRKEEQPAASNIPNEGPFAVPAKLPVQEESAQEPTTVASEPGGSETPQIAAELPHNEQPVAVSDQSNWLSPIPVQPELPWEEARVQTPPLVIRGGSYSAPPQVAAAAARENVPVVSEKEASPAMAAAIAAEALRKIDPAPMPRIAPNIQRDDTPPKVAAELNGSHTPAPVSHGVPFETHFESRPVNAPPIPMDAPLQSDKTVPASRRRQWREDAQRNWLLRLLGAEGEDPRSATRESLPELVAYFFTGAAPAPHTVRNISLTGLYLVTQERWYKGTIVQMTLADRRRSTQECSLTLHAEAVRLGIDGVGFRFVLEEDHRRHVRINKRSALTNGIERILFAPTNGVDLSQVSRFIHRFKATYTALQ